MDKLVSKLIIYRNLGDDNLLASMAGICRDFKSGSYEQGNLIDRCYELVHKLLDIGTAYGFDNNLWHNYLAYLLISCENPFALPVRRLVLAMAPLIFLLKEILKSFSSFSAMILHLWSRHWVLAALVLSVITSPL